MQEYIGPLSPARSPSGGEPEYVTYGDMAAFVHRYASSILACVMTGLMLAIGYLLLAEPIFTARAEIIIDPKMPQVLRQQTGELSFSLDTAQVESQVAVLRSEKIAETVITKLNLRDDAEFQKDSGWALQKLLPQRWRSAPAEIQPDRQRTAIVKFIDGLDVRRIGLSYAIEVLYSSTDPDKAALIANGITDAYVRDQLDTKAQAARQGSEWLEERINQLRAQMNGAAQAVQRYKASHDYRIVRKQADEQAEKAAARVEDETSLEELESTAATYRRIYESYLQAFTESVQRQSFPVADARVITPATRPLSKSRPKTSLVLGFGTLLGALSGLGIAFLQHMFDRSVRTPRQVRDETGIDCLGQVAKLDAVPLLATLQQRFRGAPALHHFDAVVQAPFSPFANSLKQVSSALRLVRKRSGAHSFAITSAFPEAGRTTIAANLAALLGTSGANVLLIDGDYVSRDLTKSLGGFGKPGLLDVVGGHTDLADAVMHLDLLQVDFLPAGHGGVDAGTWDEAALKAMLAEARKTYDVVIADSPALNRNADNTSLAAAFDAVIVASVWSETSVEQLAEVLVLLRAGQARVCGAVVNKVGTLTSDSFVRRLRDEQMA